MGVENKRQVIDDTLLYQPDVGSSFNHTAKYLTLCGKNGIILNPAKFKFAEEEVEWAGVKLTKDGASHQRLPCSAECNGYEVFLGIGQSGCSLLCRPDTFITI